MVLRYDIQKLINDALVPQLRTNTNIQLLNSLLQTTIQEFNNFQLFQDITYNNLLIPQILNLEFLLNQKMYPYLYSGGTLRIIKNNDVLYYITDDNLTETNIFYIYDDNVDSSNKKYILDDITNLNVDFFITLRSVYQNDTFIINKINEIINQFRIAGMIYYIKIV